MQPEPSSSGGAPPDRVASIFAEYLTDRADGGSSDFDELCREHPELEPRLRALHADLERWVALTRALGGEGDACVAIRGGLAVRSGPSDRYRVKDEVARGAMGVILRVWDEDLHRHVAMKVNHGAHPVREPGDREDSSQQLARFLEEAQVTSQLDHPGIVPVHELGLDADGRVYFTMKLVKGRTLRDVIELATSGDEGWSRTRALEVVLKVCDAMAYAHHKGVIHRDLKPGNVMVGRFGEVYVMDWGLARILGRDDGRDLRIRHRPESQTGSLSSMRRLETDSDLESPLFTMDGHVVGTPAYMPPEQARGRTEELGPQADVYSVGAILYHVLTARVPYVEPGQRVSAYTVLYWVCTMPPKAVEELAPDVPPELASICAKAMARESGDRYASMEALGSDLRAYLDGKVVQAYETGAWAEARKWVRRNRPFATSLAAGLVLAVGGLSAVSYVKIQGEREAHAAWKRSEENERLASRERDNVLRLSAFVKLDALVSEADALWPCHPDLVDDWDRWLSEAARVVAGLDANPADDDVGHRARLAYLRSRALPWTDEQREADRLGHPRYDELVALEGRLSTLRRVREMRRGPQSRTPFSLDVAALPDSSDELNGLAWPLVAPDRTELGREPEGLALAELAYYRSPAGSPARAEVADTLAWALFANGMYEDAVAVSEVALEAAAPEGTAEFEGYLERLRREIETVSDERALEKLAAEVEALREEVSARRTWTFEDAEERWWHDQLAKLVETIEAFADEESGLVEGFSVEHGLGVRRRRELSLRLAERTLESDTARARWREAIAAIRSSPAYGGLELDPQFGLLPLGPDPESGLWEFGHPLTGAIPERDEGGRIEMSGETGLVFVLVPGGKFWMGAQKSERDARNFDPNSGDDEGPVHEVTLEPFFISKYEMTQGQWERFTGENPSYYADTVVGGQTIDTRHPVEQVSWLACTDVLRRLGLVLPSEAQWEYAARAGTATPWWTGEDPQLVADAANLADASVKGQASWQREEWSDGHVVHAAVGSFRPNGFGLCDVLGNVWEWCLDRFEGDFYDRSPAVNPVNRPSNGEPRVYRGGGFDAQAMPARSALRYAYAPGRADETLGLRPALLLRTGSR